MTSEQLERGKEIANELEWIKSQLNIAKNHFAELKKLKNDFSNPFTIVCTNNGSFNLSTKLEYQKNYEVFLILQEKTLTEEKAKLEKELEVL